MKAEFINPFVQSLLTVLGKEAPGEWTRGRLSLGQNLFHGNDLNVMIGVTGTIEGQVVLSMDVATAQSIISAMTEQAVSDIDELGKSALGELANMVTGNAVAALSEVGHSVLITPPSLFAGRQLIVTTVMPVLTIPLSSSRRNLVAYIALKEKDARGAGGWPAGSGSAGPTRR